MRDRSRSFFPLIIITTIVAIIIFFSGFLNGIYNSLFFNTALVNSGHVKVVTHAYNLEYQLLPNDLALLDTKELVEELNNKYSNYIWTPRITFAGLLDVPDANGETLSQSPTIALGIDFLSEDSQQLDVWNIDYIESDKWEEVPDEDLWEDGELKLGEVFDKINYHLFHKTFYV